MQSSWTAAIINGRMLFNRAAERISYQLSRKKKKKKKKQKKKKQRVVARMRGRHSTIAGDGMHANQQWLCRTVLDEGWGQSYLIIAFRMPYEEALFNHCKLHSRSAGFRTTPLTPIAPSHVPTCRIVTTTTSIMVLYSLRVRRILIYEQ